LAVDASEYLHISYYDNTNGNLRYAYEDATGWHIQTVDSLVNVEATSLALDGEGYPHISYAVGYDEYGLKYAYEDEAGWHVEIVMSQPYTHFYDTSLALDASGYPHISCYDGTGYDLEYAYKDGTGWHIQTVDSEGTVGRYCSLNLDSIGRAHICYYDDTNKDLKYARMVSLPVVAGSTVLAAGPALPVQLTALAVWPNPARGVVHARLAVPEGKGVVRLTVVDLLGRRVMSLQQPGTMGGDATVILRLPESIPTGQYLLGVEGDGARQFVPITVVK